ncbi:MAG: DUF3014 domain-containing protein [Lysobacterales bacterium]
MKKAVPVIVLVLLFGSAAWYSLTKPPEEVHVLPPPPVTPALPDIEQQQPTAENTTVFAQPESVAEVPPEPLPELTESDAEVTRDLVDIAGSSRLADYLTMDQVISRAVASIDSLTSRQVPVNINPVKAVDDKLIVDTEGDTQVLSPRNFDRYDDYVALLRDMDSDGLVTFYRSYYPLFQQAWEQNGGEGSFNDRLAEVIDNLLAAPDPDGPILLYKPEAVYLFEDPELESMTAGQKVLVRMGSANAAVVKEKLQEIRAALTP